MAKRVQAKLNDKTNMGIIKEILDTQDPVLYFVEDDRGNQMLLSRDGFKLTRTRRKEASSGDNQTADR